MDKIDCVLTIEELKLIRDSLKGSLVRNNDMNFIYLNRITELGKYIEECINNEND